MMVWNFLQFKAQRLVRLADNSPVLYSYGADGTTLLSRAHYSFELGGQKLHAAADKGVEYLVQKAYLKTVPWTLGPVSTCLYRAPLPMTEGKKGWNLYQAFRDFFPTLRSLGHSGLVVNHFVFDRAICGIMGASSSTIACTTS